MKNFYKILLVFIFLADIFIACVFCVILLFGEVNTTVLILIFIFIPLIAIIETLLIKYYRNIVIEVVPKGDYVEIITNKKVYHLPKCDVVEIKEVRSMARTYITCKNKDCPKIFVFQMTYFPFVFHYLDIDSLQKELPNTVFIRNK